MRLDLTVLVGLLLGVAALVLGFVFGGGNLGALMEGTSAIIVFGGTIGATAVSFSKRDILRVPSFLRMAFTDQNEDPLQVIDHLCHYVDEVRQAKSVLKLESVAKGDDNDAFLQQGLKLIANNRFDPDELENKVLAEHEATQRGVELFETAGGYAPTMGIAGTVMGLIHVLGSISGGADVLASSIAMAFTATLYGVGSANLFWLPVSANLRTKAQNRLLIRELEMQGLTWLNTNTPESSKLLRAKLLDILQTRWGTQVEQPTAAGSQPARRATDPPGTDFRNLRRNP